MEFFADPFDVAKNLIESVVLETARGRRCADVYIVDGKLDVAFASSPGAGLPWWSRPIVRGMIVASALPATVEARAPQERIVSVRPLSSDLFVITIESKRRAHGRRPALRISHD